MTPPPQHSYRRELFLNQAWQGLNFLSKAAFLALLTPLMLRTWGAVGFALFALASTVLVSMATLDFGVRSSTRLRICAALLRNDAAAVDFAVCEGGAAFGLVSLAACAVAGALAAAGLWSRWLQLPPEGNFLIAMTVVLVCLFMMSTILLEPMVAKGRLSVYKAANTVGALAAIPVLAALVWRGGSPTTGVFAYFLCLLVPNLVLLQREKILHTGFWKELRRLRASDVLATFRTGGWFYTTSIAAVAKTHGLTFLVSALGGPAMAGTFYILLRITEIIGTLGVTSSDTTLAALASEPEPGRRGENFRHAYSYALIFCLHGALATGFLAPIILLHWLPADQLRGLSPGIGWLMAAYGLATAASKLIVCSAIPVGIFRRATYGNLAEAALTLAAGAFLLPRFGLAGLFAGASPTVLALIPAAIALAHNFGERSRRTWLDPLRPLAWPLVLSAAVLAAGAAFHQLLPAAVAAACVGVSTGIALRRLHREEAAA